MLIEKLSTGVLRVLTPLGPRYLKPSFWQRVYLLWLFRNFETLPVKVLTSGQQRRIETMCSQHGFLHLLTSESSSEMPIIGTLEQRPPVDLRKSGAHSESELRSPFAADHPRP